MDWDEKKLLQNERARTTKDLLEMGKTNQDIDSAFSIILAYLQGLEQASEENLSHIHEQEITNRVVTIGQKP